MATDPAVFAAPLATALWSHLKGGSSEPLALPSLADPDDPLQRHRLAVALAHSAVLESRLVAARSLDRTQVSLADGTKLSWDEAEEKLSTKEAQAAFPPLRDAMARAAAAVDTDRSGGFDEQLSSLGEDPLGLGPAPLEIAMAHLKALLEETAGAGEAAIAVLQEAGDGPWRSSADLMRALDLPDDAGAFGDESVRRLTRAFLDAASVHQTRGVARVRVPRSLCGQVFALAPGPVRLGFAPSRRMARADALLVGGATAVVFGVLGEGGLGDDEGAPTDEVAFGAMADEAGRALGAVLGLGAMQPLLRRSLLDEPRDRAFRACQRQRAAWVLRLRASAAIATGWLGGRSAEAARDELAAVVGMDPGLGWVREGAAPAWPVSASLRTRPAEAAARAIGAAFAAAAQGPACDAWDEAFGITAPFYERLAGARAGLLGGAVSAAALLDVPLFDPEPDAAAPEATGAPERAGGEGQGPADDAPAPAIRSPRRAFRAAGDWLLSLC